MANAFSDHVCEMMAGLGPVRAGRMFGGVGLWLGDVMFGLIAADVLYLKTDETTRPAFIERQMEPFSFARGSKVMVTSYWRAPEETLDDPAEMLPWAKQALAVGRRTKIVKRRGPTVARAKKVGTTTAATKAANKTATAKTKAAVTKRARATKKKTAATKRKRK